MLSLLQHLWPDFSYIWSPGFQTMELGVWLWSLMLLITGLSFFFVVRHKMRCVKQIQYIRSLIEGQDKNSLAVNRRATREKALKQDEYTGALWREFDESLVYSADKHTLSNTLDSEHFFNNKTLAHGLTSSRLLSAAPTFLTSIGVLGTFIGLTIGLKDLQVNVDEIDALKSGVATMINGAALAFMTSVWGVGFSLILNVFEKLVERGALEKIRKLQIDVDFLYPRIPAEQSLVHISEATHQSKDALLELHERIGDRLQETVSGISDSMQNAFSEALNNVMAPAIETMSTNASQQSTEVLESLVANFMDGMKTAGQEQGNMLQSAAGDVSNAVSSMSNRMDAVFKQLSEQQNKIIETTEDSSRGFAEHLERLRSGTEKQQEEIRNSYIGMTEQLAERIGQQLELAEKRDKAREEELSKSQQALTDNQSKALNEFRKVSSEQIEQIQQTAQNHQDELANNQQQLLKDVAEGVHNTQQQMLQMGEQHKQLLSELRSATEASERSSQNMNSSSTQLGLLSSNLKKTAEVLDTRLHEVTVSLENTSKQNGGLAEQMSGQLTRLQELQSSIKEVSKHLELAAQSAENGFKNLKSHQAEFLHGIHDEFTKLGESLKDQVGGIEEQAENWLRSYSKEVNEQVTERMEVWNKNTQKFADQMQRTVKAISGIVDDLEHKQ